MDYSKGGSQPNTQTGGHCFEGPRLVTIYGHMANGGHGRSLLEGTVHEL
jgi:hypothetical protein